MSRLLLNHFSKLTWPSKKAFSLATVIKESKNGPTWKSLCKPKMLGFWVTQSLSNKLLNLTCNSWLIQNCSRWKHWNDGHSAGQLKTQNRLQPKHHLPTTKLNEKGNHYSRFGNRIKSRSPKVQYLKANTLDYRKGPSNHNANRSLCLRKKHITVFADIPAKSPKRRTVMFPSGFIVFYPTQKWLRRHLQRLNQEISLPTWRKVQRVQKLEISQRMGNRYRKQQSFFYRGIETQLYHYDRRQVSQAGNIV